MAENWVDMTAIRNARCRSAEMGVSPEAALLIRGSMDDLDVIRGLSDKRVEV